MDVKYNITPIVDVLGNLQPSTGQSSDVINSNIIFTPIYKNYVYKWYLYTGTKAESVELKTWNDYKSEFSKENLLNRNYVSIDENTFVRSETGLFGTSEIKIKIDENVIIQSFKKNNTVKNFNVLLNIEENDIFKKYVGNKLNCYYEFGNILWKDGDGTQCCGGKMLYDLSNAMRSYFNVQTFYKLKNKQSYKDPIGWKSELLKEESDFEDLIKTISSYIPRAIDSGELKKEDVPSCFLADPDPALKGPPTQNISGVSSKPPVVDNPNVTLPSQEVKSLSGDVKQVVADAKSPTSVDNVINKAENGLGEIKSAGDKVTGGASNILGNLGGGLVGGAVLGAGIGALAGKKIGKSALIGAAAGAATGILIGGLSKKLNPKGITPDGLGKTWSPDKYTPESIAGKNTTINPRTGAIGKVASGIGNVAKGVAGAVGGAVKAVKNVAGGVVGGAVAGAAIGAAGGAVGGAVVKNLSKGVVKGAVTGAVVGGVVGGITSASKNKVNDAKSKLDSIKKGMPTPNVPKPPNLPRIKVVDIPKPKI